MPRGLVLFLLAAALIAVGGIWGLPIFKQKLFGNMQPKINIPWAVESNDVEYQGMTVTRTIVTMEIIFPGGAVPDSANDLSIYADGAPVEVHWPSPKVDDVEGGVKWVLKDVFLPAGFREGMMRWKDKDLFWIRLQNVRKENDRN